MSIIGIDVGSSSVKAVAYREDGLLLVSTRAPLTPLHPEPGTWEQDANEVWLATCRVMGEIAAGDAVRRDPPSALALSASGRENFLVDAEGLPLCHALMGADVRGAEFETPPPGSPSPEAWTLSCGHQRERMDPMFRLLWWVKTQPELVRQARYWLGWPDFLALRMCGDPVTDPSCASRYLVYDLVKGDWSRERMTEFGIEPSLLPRVGRFGSLIGDVDRHILADWGISSRVVMAVGCHDSQSAALGMGATGKTTASFVFGSYENIVKPEVGLPTESLLRAMFSIMPFPCSTGLSLIGISPTGSAVMDWARGLFGVTVEQMTQALEASGDGPSAVVAVPYLSGAMLHWPEGRKLRGAVLGLTLATTPSDILKALMESVAYDHARTLEGLRAEGIPVNRIRAAGGGARSLWWTQLKADMLGVPIEVVDQPEPGTLGAAILAGNATGVYPDIEAASVRLAKVARSFDPDPRRREAHRENMQRYAQAVRGVLTLPN